MQETVDGKLVFKGGELSSVLTVNIIFFYLKKSEHNSFFHTVFISAIKVITLNNKISLHL